MAGRISEDKLEEIKNAINIADYIGRTVQLKKQGQNLFGLCPFHDENTPSFAVNEEKQFFHCYSCGRGGSVFDFIMDSDNLPFPQAVKKAADYAGVELNIDTSAVQAHVDPAQKRQKEILKLTEDFMHHLLMNTESGSAALDYVQKRGMSTATIEHFGIGFAPSDGSLLQTFLKTQKVSIDEMRATGLFVDRDSGELGTRFTNRVMFPLRDERGETVGFSGRTLSTEKTQAKYLNSPETIVFNKGELLFNLDEAKQAVRGTDPFYLFEGFMDVIAAYQAGVTSGVASMGTSLTPQQVHILERRGKSLVVVYDGDHPGQAATERALKLLQGSSLDVSAVVLPGEMDPDEFIQKNGGPAFKTQLQSVLTPTAFRLHYLAQGVDMVNDHAKLEYIAAALKEIKALSSAVEQTLYLQQVADLTSLPLAALQKQLAELPEPRAEQTTVQSNAERAYDPQEVPLPDDSVAPPPPDDEAGQQGGYGAPAAVVQQQEQQHFTRYERAERELLHYMLTDAETSLFVFANPFDWPEGEYGVIAAAWQEFCQTHTPTIDVTPEYQTFVDQQSGSHGATLSSILMEDVPPVTNAAVSDLIAVIGQGTLAARLAAIRTELKQARRLGDKQKQADLSSRYFELMRVVQAQR
ncbi:DNA primase [Lacticaseibacillus zhaodongensis]|uniref:DNA primase n=1 Tax=Lacticaseibacillus zhaodongensis TaxID=2668065 RepID=UPI0018AF61A7|nr:DNA primase [Lacticaseibacillus zhaodongensis]